VSFFGFGHLWQCVRRQVAADNEFYARNVAPHVEATRRESAAFDEAFRRQQQGQKVPLPPIVEMLDSAPINQWAARIQLRSHMVFMRDMSLLGLIGTLSVWTILATIQGMVARRKWEAPSREAVPEAGRFILELINSKEVFVAKADGGVEAPKVEVDGRRLMVVFQNFAFITAFVGNPVLGQVEVPFADLIVTSIYYANGKAHLVLRIAKGKVTVGAGVQPFDRLSLLLSDAAELNRTFPDRYQDALAREPKVQTPWYGWVIIGAAVASAGAAFWWFVVRG
jgi:hypothetical protein